MRGMVGSGSLPSVRLGSVDLPPWLLPSLLSWMSTCWALLPFTTPFQYAIFALEPDGNGLKLWAKISLCLSGGCQDGTLTQTGVTYFLLTLHLTIRLAVAKEKHSTYYLSVLGLSTRFGQWGISKCDMNRLLQWSCPSIFFIITSFQ